MKRMIAFIASAAIVLIVVILTVFVVDLRHMAIVSSSNHATPLLVGPGVHVKLPPPFQAVTLIDARVQAFAPSEAVRCTTTDKVSLLVMPVVRYRVSEPLKLFAATNGTPGALPDRMTPLVRDALVTAFSHDAFSNIVAQQPNVAHAVRDALKASAASLGLDVLDVEFTRVDYSQEQAGAVYQRMKAALAQQATNAGAKNGANTPSRSSVRTGQNAGAAAGTATQPQTPFLRAQAIRATADAQAAAIIAQAGARDPKFYQFWQRMQAYRASFRPGDVLVLDSSSDFFRFMRDPADGQGTGKGRTGKTH